MSVCPVLFADLVVLVLDRDDRPQTVSCLNNQLRLQKKLRLFYRWSIILFKQRMDLPCKLMQMYFNNRECPFLRSFLWAGLPTIIVIARYMICPSHIILMLAPNIFFCSHRGFFTLELISLFFGTLFCVVEYAAIKCWLKKNLFK